LSGLSISVALTAGIKYDRQVWQEAALSNGFQLPFQFLVDWCSQPTLPSDSLFQVAGALASHASSDVDIAGNPIGGTNVYQGTLKFVPSAHPTALERFPDRFEGTLHSTSGAISISIMTLFVELRDPPQVALSVKGGVLDGTSLENEEFEVALLESDVIRFGFFDGAHTYKFALWTSLALKQSLL
jgi:hypothetical protein